MLFSPFYGLWPYAVEKNKLQFGRNENVYYSTGNFVGKVPEKITVTNFFNFKFSASNVVTLFLQ